MRHLCAVFAPFTFFSRVANAFTWQFACTLIAVYALLKGGVNEIVKTACLPYFKSLGVSGQTYQSLYTVVDLPWSLKGAMGILADTVPIAGYHKLPYILLSSALGLLAYALLAAVQFSAPSAPAAAFLLFLAFFQIAFVDLLTEAKYAELMQARPRTGGDVVSLVYALYFCGSLLGATVSGPLADRLNPRFIFAAVLPLAALALAPALLGWFPDARLPPPRRGVRVDKLRRHAPLVKLAAAVTASAAATGMAAVRLSGAAQAGAFVANAAALLALAALWLPPVMRRANLYFFLANALYVAVDGATDYWFTADGACVPGGPAFSYTFFSATSTLVSCAAGAAGVALFQRVASRSHLRTVFAALCALKIAGSLPDIAIITRLNRAVGVPDSVAFLLGDAVVRKLTTTMEFLPAVVLTAKICPAGMEATTFAILASFMNLGGAGARALGVGLIELLGIRTVAPCNFERLSLAVFIAHVVLPSFLLPLIYVLIPDKMMTDEILDDYEHEEQQQPLLSQ